MSVLVIIGIVFLVGFLINHIIEYKKLKFDNMILNEQVNEIKNNFKIYRTVSGCEKAEVENLRNRNTMLLMENMALKSLVDTYQNVYGNDYQNTNYTERNSKDTVDAVRYAMKHAHPDNGGNAEDFIRFKKCYEELTK